MATTEILSIGTSASNSDSFTLAAGEQCTLSIKRSGGEPLSGSGGGAELRKQDSDADYNPTGHGLSGEFPTMVLQAEGTYLLARGLSDDAFGIDIDGGTVNGGP